MTGWLFVATVLNLIGYLLNWPSMFALTATIYYVAFSVMLAQGEAYRRTSPKNNSIRAAYAGIIIELIGAALSFFAVPFGGLAWGSILDVIMLIVVAVFDIIGAAIFANMNNTGTAAGIFVILAIFALGILFGARGLLYASCVLATVSFMTILPGAFNVDKSNSAGRKQVAACVMTFIGMMLNAFWVVVTLHVFREDNDMLDGGDESTTTNTANNNATANKA